MATCQYYKQVLGEFHIHTDSGLQLLEVIIDSCNYIRSKQGSWVGILACRGCRNEVPQAAWLEQQKHI